MLPYTSFDTLRFKNEEEAKKQNELYTIEYTSDEMKITDPDGNVKVIKLNYNPVCGLDVSDHYNLSQYLNSDMEKRDNNANQK